MSEQHDGEVTPSSVPTECRGVSFVSLSSVRAKFIVTKVEVYQPTSRLIAMKPVYSQDPTHENKAFWDATPNGELTMTINNPTAAEFFRPGEEYYIDFSPAPHDPSVQEAIDRYHASLKK